MINELKKIIHDDETVNFIADRVMEIQGKNNYLLPYLYQQKAEAEKGIDNLVNTIQMAICVVFNIRLKWFLKELLS